jgi:hypothetical protein
MNIRRVDVTVIAAAAALVGVVSVLPSPRDNNPPIPNTVEHRGWTSEKHCPQCHVEGKEQALPTRHPKRTDCWRCHRDASARERVDTSAAASGTTPLLISRGLQGGV